MDTRRDELLTILRSFGYRLRLRDAWDLAQRWLWVASLACAGILALGRFLPLENRAPLALLPFLLWLFAILAVALLRHQTHLRIAHRLDRELGLKERLSTAVIYCSPELNANERELPRLQRFDALHTARAIDPKRAFAYTWQTRPLVVAGVLVVAAGLLGFLPNPMDQLIAEREAVREALDQQADEIEKLAAELEASQELSPEARQELLRQLEELARLFRENPGDKEQALADLSRLTENVRRQLNPTAGLKSTALESLAARLQALTQRNLSDDTPAPGLAEALKELAEQMPEMQTENRNDLAQALAQLSASAAEAGQMDLAQALNSLAQAALSGDGQAASLAAESVANALGEAQQQLSDQQSLQRILTDLQSTGQAIAQAGSIGQTAQGQNPGDGQAQNQGEGQGQGQNQGQSQGQGQGQPGGGGGTRSDTLPPGQSTGSAGDPTGPGQSAQAGRLEAQVYVPEERLQGSGDELFIPGQDSGQGETQVREGEQPLPGLTTPALVPYQQVFSNYLQSASQAIDQGYIPPGLRDFIRDYFSQLEP